MYSVPQCQIFGFRSMSVYSISTYFGICESVQILGDVEFNINFRSQCCCLVQKLDVDVECIGVSIEYES